MNQELQKHKMSFIKNQIWVILKSLVPLKCV